MLTDALGTGWTPFWTFAAAVLVFAALVVGLRVLQRSSNFGSSHLKAALKLLFKPIVLLLGLGFVTSGSRGLNRHSLPFWSWLNALALVLLVMHAPSLLTLTIAAAVLALHVLCFVSVLLVTDEETDVWNGLLTPAQATYGSAKFIKQSSVLVISTAFALLFAAQFVWLWDQLRPERLIERPPALGCSGTLCSYLQYLVAIISEIPGVGWALNQIGLHGRATLTEWPGGFLQFAINFVAVTLVYGVFKVLIIQQKAINDLVTAFGRADELTIDYLRLRAERAPVSILEKIIEKALRHPNAATRARFTDAAIKSRIPAFPALFLQNLPRECDVNNKRKALAAIREVAESEAHTIGVDELAKVLAALKQQTEDYKQSKRVLRELDMLLLLHAGLLNAHGQKISRERFPGRIYEIAIVGEDEIREQAFKLASQIRPIDLCHALAEHLTMEILVEDENRPRLHEALFKIETLLRDRAAGWRQTPRRRLRASFQRAQRELAGIRRLAGTAMPRALARLTPEQRTDLSALVEEAIAAMELFCELVMPPLAQDNEPPQAPAVLGA